MDDVFSCLVQLRQHLIMQRREIQCTGAARQETPEAAKCVLEWSIYFTFLVHNMYLLFCQRIPLGSAAYPLRSLTLSWSLEADSAALFTSGELLSEIFLAGLGRTFHSHAGDSGCETPLEKSLGVRRLVFTVQLTAHEVLSDSLWTRGTGCSHITGSFTGTDG